MLRSSPCEAGPDDEALQGVAHREEQRREHDCGEIGIEAEQPVREESREHRRGQQRAVREIDDVQHAVDQRQAERDQRVDGAGHEPVEDRGNGYRRQHGLDRAAGRRHPCAAACRQARGIGNTGFADANVAGKMTWMSLPSTWVLTGAAPWFWPLTNLVGP